MLQARIEPAEAPVTPVIGAAARHSASSTDVTRPAVHGGGHTHSPGATHSSTEDIVHRELDRDKFVHSHIGKPDSITDPIAPRLMSKPYMYITCEGVHTQKQKLDIRPTLSAIEYIDPTLSLMADKRAYHPDDYNHIMYHLRKFTRDATERPWPAVRRWSQYIWDIIEAGQITWANREVIQEERVRMCLTAPPPPSNGTYIGSQQGQLSILCAGGRVPSI